MLPPCISRPAWKIKAEVAGLLTGCLLDSPSPVAAFNSAVGIAFLSALRRSWNNSPASPASPAGLLCWLRRSRNFKVFTSGESTSMSSLFLSSCSKATIFAASKRFRRNMHSPQTARKRTAAAAVPLMTPMITTLTRSSLGSASASTVSPLTCSEASISCTRSGRNRDSCTMSSFRVNWLMLSVSRSWTRSTTSCSRCSSASSCPPSMPCASIQSQNLTTWCEGAKTGQPLAKGCGANYRK
mmetsp:Transcript_38057/g.96328  ORF Transcript_38057/g.96328 Transcript_38057/m.96328 type:complete len:241 (-) Transcript_38057:117-839(-)